MKHILTQQQLCDVEMILTGAFAPLEGFMNEHDYKNVIKHNRLSNGSIWTIPIYLIYNGTAKIGDVIDLHKKDGHCVAKLTVDDMFHIDLNEECINVYGTTDDNHPGVKYLKTQVNQFGTLALGGNICTENMKLHFDHTALRKSPREWKEKVEVLGWKNVIGFQTRNPLHNSHIQLMKNALCDVSDGGVLIHPAIGPTQPGDIDYNTRIKCYKAVTKHYSDLPLALSVIPLAMRMAGPREAVWHAIIRRNYGCTHFIMGRDPAGPSTKTKEGKSFYSAYAAHELADSFGDELGIKILKSQELSYSPSKDGFFPKHTLSDATHISGTEFRRMLRNNEEIPEWFSLPEVISILHENLACKGTCIYIMGLSGSGKTTLARALQEIIEENTHQKVVVLDGDEVRRNLSKELGFSREDRSTNVRRIGYVASLIAKTGGTVICANIAPYEDDREWIRQRIRSCGNYFEVFLNTPLDVCEERDVKGLYKKARQGIIPHFTGISDPFDQPNSKNAFILDTTKKTPAVCCNEILKHCCIRF